MSSKSQGRTALEAWLVLTIMVAASAWYASNQLLYSLYFVYQLARFLFPGVVPAVDPA